MNTSVNNFDALEQLIHQEGIRIQTIDVHPDMDMFIIILNTGSVLKEKISNFPKLKNATASQLLNYQLIGKGTGIHWPVIDEDLSLKGFLRDTIKSQITGNNIP